MAERVVPVTKYCLVFVALIALTGLTIGVSFLEVGTSWHLVIGLTIAGCKAILVALFFMHLIDSTRLMRLVIVAALFWLGIMMALTLTDYFTRHWQA